MSPSASVPSTPTALREPVAPAATGGLESAAGTPAADGRFPCLDGLRAIAALAVVLTHLGFQTGYGIDGPLRAVLSRFDIGVAVFFVLSGFLLHRPQAVAALSGRPLPAVRPYLWRRALRVLPAYWLVVVVAMLVVPANDGAPLASWLRQLTLTSTYVADDQRPALTQMWSLCTEVSFYLALPLLGRLVRGRGLRGQLSLCAVLYATAVAWQVTVGTGGLPVQAGFWLPGHADWFALGMALAALSAQATVRPGGWASALGELADDAGTCWVGAAVLFAVAGTPLTGPYRLDLLTPSETVSRSLLYGLAAALLLLPGVAGRQDRGAVRAVLRSRPAAFLGRVSYGVFLVHLVVLDVAARALGVEPFTGHFPLLTAVVVPTSVVLAWLSLRLVEEPALRLRDRGPGRRAPARG